MKMRHLCRLFRSRPCKEEYNENSLPFILIQYPIGHKNNEKKKDNNISHKQ